MDMILLLLFLTLLKLYSSDNFSSKPAFLQINDLYSSNIARDGKDKFLKVDENAQSTIISSHPIEIKAVTKVKILLQVGATFMIGCGLKDKQKMANQYVGQIPNTVAYYTESGAKMKLGDSVGYAQKCLQGDTATMIIDIRENEKLVRYEKNDRLLGIAYTGLQDWNEIYIMFSICWAGTKIKILEYSVTE